MNEGESSGGSSDEKRAPSYRDGETDSKVGVSGSMEAVDAPSRRIGRSASLLVLLDARGGDVVMLRLLVGRAKGLVGRSEPWLIWLGRRTKGLAFSGEREFGFVGDRVAGAFVGDEEGVAPRTVAGEALFWRRKGDWRPVALSNGDKGDGR